MLKFLWLILQHVLTTGLQRSALMLGKARSNLSSINITKLSSLYCRRNYQFMYWLYNQHICLTKHVMNMDNGYVSLFILLLYSMATPSELRSASNSL